MTFQKKVVYSFNNFYLNFLTDMKKNNDCFRKHVKKNYKVFDKASPVYFETLKTSIDDQADKEDGLDNICLLPSLTYKDILAEVKEDDVGIIKSYTLIFKVLVSIYSDDDETILERVLEIIKSIQSPDNEDKDDMVKGKLKTILDDELLGLLEEFYNVSKTIKDHVTIPEIPTSSEQTDVFKMLENSKIGSLAKEISEEINFKDLNLQSPEQLLDFSNLGSSNNVLGSIIGKVSSSIQSKIQNGQLSQTDLVNEAMSLVGMMNGGGGAGNIFSNPMLSELLGNMTGMSSSGRGAGKNTRVQVDSNKLQRLSTKERLREKLEKRKEQEQQEEQK